MENKQSKSSALAALSAWFGEHITHKVVLAVVAVGVVNWVLLAFIFLAKLDGIIRHAYASTLTGETEELVLQALHGQMFASLTIFSIGVFLVIMVALYLLVLAPIVHLRQTMRRYYEAGERPQRTQRRDEVGRLQNTFADLIGVIDRKEQAERRLIASISHDIKTPLTSVLGYSERLLSASLGAEKQEQYLTLIHEKALRLKAVVDEFDDYLDVGLRGTDPMSLVTAEELCRRLREEYAAELGDAGVSLTVVCHAPQAQIFCNWEHLRRLFGNLISNSINHANAPQLKLDLDCWREGDRLVLAFRDNGQGVDPQLLEQIFEPLYTSDAGRKVSGLGLSICKSIVKAHGGTIHAENAPAGGLLLRIALPCVEL